jgi:outer membrane protein TolC
VAEAHFMSPNDMRTSTATPLLASLLSIAFAAPAAAQPPPPAPAAPAPPAPSARPAPMSDADLPVVGVTDEALRPMPPAMHVLAGWRDALTLTSSRSVDVAIARQGIERAEGLWRQALAQALPTITATGTLTKNLFPGDKILPTLATAQLDASQPILAPRAWYGIKTADLGVKQAKQSTDDRRRTVLAQVADAIVGVFAAERVAEINRLGLRNALQHVAIAERKSNLGDGKRLDVLRAQQDAETARATLIAGDEALLKAREALGLSLGSAEPWGVPPTISLDEMQQALGGACRPGTIDDRADVAAARTGLDIAGRNVTDAKLAFAPTAVVSTTAIAGSGALDNLRTSMWSIQGVLTIPLWEGGARYGGLRIAHAGEEEAKLRFDATRRNATVEVTQAVRAVTVAEQARVVAERRRDLAREGARLAERSYAAGVATSFDLIDAGRNERSAELDLALREFDLVRSKIAALLATAGCAY